MRPAEYRHSCTVSKEVPYSVVDSASKGTHSGEGILNIGRVVWLDHKLESSSGGATCTAFADGIGLITVDPRSLSNVS